MSITPAAARSVSNHPPVRPGLGVSTTGTSSSSGLLTPARGAKRRRPTEFLLPDGRKVLVALPQDAEVLKTKYKFGSHAHGRHEQDEGTQVEVVVHGSAEHRQYLHLTKAHHESRKHALREKLGEHVHVLDELMSVSSQLGDITNQIQKVAQQVDRSVTSLKTNFSKFGYDAQLRTYADDDDIPVETGLYGNGSGNDTPSPGDGKEVSRRSSFTFGGSRSGTGTGTAFGEDDDYGGRDGGDTMKLFRRPVVKQYFHRGLLWRASEETQVMSFELFFDLLYVGILAVNGDHAAEEYNGHELLRFVVTFIMSWQIWSGVTQLISWFETNDVLQRVQVLFLIACLLGQTTNMLQAFHEAHDTYTQLVAFYVAGRLFMAAYYGLTAFLVPLVKGPMMAQIIHTVAGVAFWMGSTAVEMPNRLILIFIAIVIDLFGSMVHVAMFRYGRSHDSKLAVRFANMFEFYPAINIEHKVERTNAFVTLVLGYSVVALIFQNASKMGFNAFLGKAILGLVQGFVFNWLYFEVDGSNLQTHAIRRSPNTAFIWQHAHLSFVMAYILAAAALSKMVVATDCANAPLEALTEFYQHRSDEEVHLGLRLYYCIGLGIALFSMGLISFSHEHRTPRGACRLPKWVRLLNRSAVCVVLFCLPAADPHHLNSLHLIAITTCLSVWVLLFETYAKACKTESFISFGAADDGKGGNNGKGCYTAQCTKKELDEAMKRVNEKKAGVDDGGEGGGGGGGEGGGNETEEVIEVVQGKELSKGEKTAVVDCQ
ncbi:bacterial low temperature requirement A protein-domain-containing protein [Apodospora peruviana]|uniref:Bacterial low temperature requirement A protein-domain-containing protein n=1 Tax=Apodospora peruviana TaxID=516989 RepID=A0AAE0M291_9PEZI|nr:bacterial low temperature requirement A protein-domain-containing protein [Apodospora peruviana]